MFQNFSGSEEDRQEILKGIEGLAESLFPSVEMPNCLFMNGELVSKMMRTNAMFSGIGFMGVDPNAFSPSDDDLHQVNLEWARLGLFLWSTNSTIYKDSEIEFLGGVSIADGGDAMLVRVKNSYEDEVENVAIPEDLKIDIDDFREYLFARQLEIGAIAPIKNPPSPQEKLTPEAKIQAATLDRAWTFTLEETD